MSQKVQSEDGNNQQSVRYLEGDYEERGTKRKITFSRTIQKMPVEIQPNNS